MRRTLSYNPIRAFFYRDTSIPEEKQLNLEKVYVFITKRRFSKVIKLAAFANARSFWLVFRYRLLICYANVTSLSIATLNSSSELSHAILMSFGPSEMLL